MYIHFTIKLRFLRLATYMFPELSRTPAGLTVRQNAASGEQRTRITLPYKLGGGQDNSGQACYNYNRLIRVCIHKKKTPLFQVTGKKSLLNN